MNLPKTAGQVFTANPNLLTAPCGPQSAFSGAQPAPIIAGDDVLQQLSINPVGTWTVTAYTYVPSTATGAGSGLAHTEACRACENIPGRRAGQIGLDLLES